MRCAQLRLRQVMTMAAVALLVALAAGTAQPRQHALGALAKAAALQGPIQRLPDGRRWY